MTTFKHEKQVDKSFKKTDLILGADNVRPIEKKNNLLSRLIYTEEVFNSNSNSNSKLKNIFKPYTAADIHNARQLLIKELKLSPRIDDAAINKALIEKIGDLEIQTMSIVPVSDADLHQPMRPANAIRIHTNRVIDEKISKKLSNYLIEVNADIASINTDIVDYNNSSDLRQKKQLLERITHKRIMIEMNAPPKIVTLCQNYTLEIHQNLYDAIHNEQAKLKRLSEANTISQPSSNIAADTSSVMLSEREKISMILRYMSVEKATQWGSLLEASYFKQSSLDLLFKKNELGYNAFRSFNNANTITVLSGIDFNISLNIGHSKNFKIAHKKTKETMALKLEERFGISKTVETQLRNTLFNRHLIQIIAERQISLAAENQTVIKSILVTDFCPEGNLMSHSKTKRASGKDLETIQSALDLYSQMAKILLEMSQADVAFPDMKNTNWLIKDNRLLIADTKSFLKTNQGIIENISEITFVYSAHVIPPELVEKSLNKQSFSGNISGKTMHASLLVKNLFQYLTGLTDPELKNILAFSNDDFNKHRIFQSEVGKELRDLIKTQWNNGYSRALASPSLEQVLDSLTRIKLKLDNETLIAQLDAYSLVDRDMLLQTAIKAFKAKQQQAAGCYGLDELKELNKNLKQTNATLKSNKATINQLKKMLALHGNTKNPQKQQLIGTILNTQLAERGVNANAHSQLLMLFDKKYAVKEKLHTLLGSWSDIPVEIEQFRKKYHEKIDQASSAKQLDEIDSELPQSWIACFKKYLNDELTKIKSRAESNHGCSTMKNLVQTLEQKIHTASDKKALEEIRDILKSPWKEAIIGDLKRKLHVELDNIYDRYISHINQFIYQFFLDFREKIDAEKNMSDLEKMQDELESLRWPMKVFKAHLHDLLHRIKTQYAINENDLKMNAFMSLYEEEINGAQQMDTLIALEKKLTNIHQKDLSGLKYVSAKIKQYRDGYHYQGHAKAKLIEDSLLNTSIEERGAIRDQRPVMNALAGRRYRLFTRVKPEDTSTSKNLAAGYTAFIALTPK